jgi:sec-independent protein translocase protein TatA
MPLALFQNIGVWEVLILLLVVLLVFGPKRLPEMGRSLGRGMREFKDSITGKDLEREEEAAAALAQAPEAPVQAPVAVAPVATEPGQPAPPQQHPTS